MILLYSLALFLLVAVGLLVARRAAALERRFARTALDAEKLVRAPVYRAGNGGIDPYHAARRQYELGQLILKRDRLEGKYVAWQKAADRLAKAVETVRGWKGRKLPYTFGALDVSVVLGLVDYLGVGEVVSVRRLIELAAALWAN
jgi:hypothetical protein